MGYSKAKRKVIFVMIIISLNKAFSAQINILYAKSSKYIFILEFLLYL